MDSEAATLSSPRELQAPRRIAFRTKGTGHRGIARLVSPPDIGERIKPFVFLDHAAMVATEKPLFRMHPHSGIATLTTVLSGGIFYEDTTGKSGELPAGGFEWMMAGNGIWHNGNVLPGDEARLFQLWIALPPSLENAPPQSQYIPPAQVQRDGRVRVLLGNYESATSSINYPEDINYFHVEMEAGETWRYVPPIGHNVSWLAIDKGRLEASESVGAGELAVFEESHTGPIELYAEVPTSFVIGSAIKHPHPLVLGYYSVHTSQEALDQGEAEIRRIGRNIAT